MASTLTVDNIVGATTSSLVEIPNHVINTDRHFHTFSGTQTVTSTSYSDITGSSFTYTPKSADSVILIDYRGNFRALGPAGQDMIAYIRPHSNGVAGYESTLAGDNLGKLGDSIWFPLFFAIQERIEAADHTTSAITIKLQSRAGGAGQNQQFNGSSGHICINVMEIGQ